jgi:simple sugar transport system ATP-binding protein
MLGELSERRVGGSEPPTLRAVGVTKRFGHVEALRNVSLDLTAGEVVGLVGDNGAGKSTFVKCVCGVYESDEGYVEIEGERVAFDSPMAARKMGIETVFQDLSLAPDISVSANVFLGRELRRHGVLGGLGFLDFRQMHERAGSFIHEIGIDLPSVKVPAELLSGGQRQAVAIARARAWASRVLLLDEPTAALGVRQTEIVLDIIRASAKSGMAILVISHDLPSILSVSDRIVVLRHGRIVADFPTEQVEYSDVVSAMLGKGV